MPKLSSEENIRQLCFLPHGLLFNEFDKIFSDLFSKRSEKYKQILQHLASGPSQQDSISDALDLKHSGDINLYLVPERKVS